MLGLENVFSAGSFQEFTNQIIGIVAMVGLLILVTKLFNKKNRMAHASKKADKITKKSADPQVYSNQSKYIDYVKSKKVEFWKNQQQHEKTIKENLKKIGKVTGNLASKAKKYYNDAVKYMKQGVEAYILEAQEAKLDENINQASILPEIKELDQALALLGKLQTEDNLQDKLDLQEKTVTILKSVAENFNEVSEKINSTTKAQYNTEKAMRKIVRAISSSLQKQDRAAAKLVKDAHELDQNVDTNLPDAPNKSIFRQFTRQKPHKAVKLLKIDKRRKNITYYIDKLPTIIELLKQLEQWCDEELNTDKNFTAVEHEIQVYETYEAAIQKKLEQLSNDTKIETPPKVEGVEKIPGMVAAVNQFDENALQEAKNHVQKLRGNFEVEIASKIEILHDLDGKNAA